MKHFDCKYAESLSGNVIQWTPALSDPLSNSNSWKFITGVIFKCFQDPFGLVIYSLQSEKIICKSCFLALPGQQSSCRIDFPTKKTCKLSASQSRENRTNHY